MNLDKKLQKKLQERRQAFFDYYSQFYSSEVLESLAQSRNCLRMHRPNCSDVDALVNEFLDQGLKLDPLDFYAWAFEISNVGAGSKPAHLNPNDHRYYLMDPASLIPVLELDPKPGSKVLDLCAAPGGKSLMITDLMQLQGELVLNEVSSSRKRRLIHNLQRMEVPHVTQATQVTQAARPNWQLEILGESPRILAEKFPKYFDYILVDAPCSSEAHVLQKPEELKKWSTSRSQLLAKRQRKIMKAAISMLKTKGRLVYSTCSLSPLENEENVEFFLEKFKELKYQDNRITIGEKRKFGRLILPHELKMGPSYIASFTCDPNNFNLD